MGAIWRYPLDAVWASRHLAAMKIYKIFRKSEWRDFQAQGVTKGAPIDLRDGYIHFSTADQVQETAAKHFHGQKDLLLVTVNADTLGDALKWEPSRGGALFPHLYAELDVAKATSVDALQDCEDGSHLFPDTY